MLSYDRRGDRVSTPIVLVHAGVADRRMWDPVWPALTAAHDVIRVDLRGFGESVTPPSGPWSARADVIELLDHLGVTQAHLVGCSFGSGVCAEIAVQRPDLVASLVLSAPGGALLTQRTDDLAAFIDAERAALAMDDLDAATEANLRWWVDGPHRGADGVSPEVRESVRTMQRRAFEITHAWPDAADEEELEPAVTDRLGEITVPTLVITGALDLETVRLAAQHVMDAVPTVKGLLWPDVAHLPSMERPDDFTAEVLDWVAADRRESLGS